MGDSSDTVTAAEIIRNFGYWQQKALSRPLTVTHHGRARVMLISTEEYERLTGIGEEKAQPESDADPMTALLNGMAECYVMHDAEMRILDVNAAAVAYFGAPREKLIGSTVSVAMGRSPNLFIHSMLRRVLRTGEYVTYDVGSTAFPGRRVTARSFPYRNHVVTLFEDVTAREAIREDALDWEATMLGLSLIDQAGVALLNRQGRFTFADACFARLTGLAMPEIAGASFADLIAPRDRTVFEDALAAAIEGLAVPALAIGFDGKAGAGRSVTLAVSPLWRGEAVSGALLAMAETGRAKAG